MNLPKSHSSARVLSVFSLVMINIVAVDSLKTVSLSAKLGPSLIFYYLICGLCFFIPVALITAELATAWPKCGGTYVWVREALGKRLGFLMVWLQWIYNVVWYPTVLAMVAATFAFMVKPAWVESPAYTVCMVLGVFWLSTWINCYGMSLSSFISTIGSLFGTLLPIGVIAGLGYWWHRSEHLSHVNWTLQSIIPEIHQLNDMVFALTIIFGLMGLEMSAVHAQEVKQPQRDYPRALLISATIILFSLMASSLAVADVIPVEQLNLITGMLQAFKIFFSVLGLDWLLNVITTLILIGLIASIAAWIIGPAKGLLAAAEDGVLPDWMAQTNQHGVPVNVLILQATVVSVLALAYLFLPSIESAFFILSALTAILGLLMYVLFFISAIRLRYSHGHVERPYRIPGGNWGIWLVAGVGIVICCFAIFLGFIAPSQLDVGNEAVYLLSMMFGVVVFCLPAFLIKLE